MELLHHPCWVQMVLEAEGHPRSDYGLRAVEGVACCGRAWRVVRAVKTVETVELKSGPVEVHLLGLMEEGVVRLGGLKAGEVVGLLAGIGLG